MNLHAPKLWRGTTPCRMTQVISHSRVLHGVVSPDGWCSVPFTVLREKMARHAAQWKEGISLCSKTKLPVTLLKQTVRLTLLRKKCP